MAPAKGATLAPAKGARALIKRAWPLHIKGIIMRWGANDIGIRTAIAVIEHDHIVRDNLGGVTLNAGLIGVGAGTQLTLDE